MTGWDFEVHREGSQSFAERKQKSNRGNRSGLERWGLGAKAMHPYRGQAVRPE